MTDGPMDCWYDAAHRCWWVPVADYELFAKLGEWSEPLQVKMENGQMIFRRPELSEAEKAS